MNCTAYIARAFCHHSLGGNPAGVVIVNQESSLTPFQMQFVAKELNFSETVFISSLRPHSYKALYFTPTSSIDFCGHATLAAFGVLKRLKLVTDRNYSLETISRGLRGDSKRSVDLYKSTFAYFWRKN